MLSGYQIGQVWPCLSGSDETSSQCQSLSVICRKHVSRPSALCREVQAQENKKRFNWGLPIQVPNLRETWKKLFVQQNLQVEIDDLVACLCSCNLCAFSLFYLFQSRLLNCHGDSQLSKVLTRGLHAHTVVVLNSYRGHYWQFSAVLRTSKHWIHSPAAS